jgi:hypothetical protein
MLLDREWPIRGAADNACALHAGYRVEALDQLPFELDDLVNSLYVGSTCAILSRK